MAAKRPALHLLDILKAIAGKTPTVTHKDCGQERPVGRRCQHCNPSTPVEDDRYIAAMQRQIRGLESRAIDNPVILAQVVMLAAQLSDVANVAIAVSSDSHKIDPASAPSMNECAEAMGIKKSSAYDRVQQGQSIVAARMAAANLGVLSLARQEKADRQRAAEHAEKALVEWKGRRAHLRAVS